MISICIPIYNFNVIDLVSSLSLQSAQLDVPSEMILIDDCSNSNYRNTNESICSEFTYIKLEKNIGRAAIRNLFLSYAKYKSLLFMDCDSVITSDTFLASYIEAIKKHPGQLICGGRDYPRSSPNRSELLRWKYGIIKESQTCEERIENPNKSFMTNNFVIDKHLFESIQFNEGLVDYGHEDTLFGFELKKRGIEIIHIDNPVMNGDLEKNRLYISNTEKAIANLIHILELVNYDKRLIEDVTLLHSYYKVYKLRGLIRISFVILRPLIRYFLSKGYVSLHLFDYYKLGTLAVKMKATQ